MTDPPRGGSGPVAQNRSTRAGGGAHFEETISLPDSRFGGFARLTSAIALVGTVGMVLIVPLAFVAFLGVVAALSGNSVVDLVTVITTGLPPSLLLFTAACAFFFVGVPLLGVLMIVRQGSLIPRNEVHTRVTDSAVEINREGGYPWQSSGVTIPFERVTSVEYNDPEGDLKVNLGDARAEKFIGGRGGNWVRIGRSEEPAVYVGSDRPRELARVVADLAGPSTRMRGSHDI